jgi:uncharacterized protein YegP (UPF0339 family)
MRTLFRSLALFAIVAALIASTGLSEAPARQKEKDKDAKKAEEVGTIEVYQAKDGWRFRVKNAEGKSVAIGTVGYDKKEECLKVVDFLKTTMAKAKVTEIKDDKK